MRSRNWDSFFVGDSYSMRIVWHKHNLMISSSVSSGYPGNYSYEIPHEYLSGWGNLSGKMISIKRNHWSNLDFFFKWRFPFSHMLRLFQDNFIFEEATSSYFFRVTISTQLLFRSSYFFRAVAFFEELLFQNSHLFVAVIFFRIATFSERNFHRAATSWE